MIKKSNTATQVSGMDLLLHRIFLNSLNGVHGGFMSGMSMNEHNVDYTYSSIVGVGLGVFSFCGIRRRVLRD